MFSSKPTVASLTSGSSSSSSGGSSGGPKVDLWAEELRYRRCVRLLLVAKARYIQVRVRYTLPF